MNQKNQEVRVVYERAGVENAYKHNIRSSMERKVCEWLMQNGIAHRHASEVFTVSFGVGKDPTVYVPDIILHDKCDGQTVLIEPFQVNAPKGGGTRVFAAFRKAMKGRYSLIVVARKSAKRNFMRGSYDAFVDIEQLGDLEKHIASRKFSRA